MSRLALARHLLPKLFDPFTLCSLACQIVHLVRILLEIEQLCSTCPVHIILDKLPNTIGNSSLVKAISIVQVIPNGFILRQYGKERLTVGRIGYRSLRQLAESR